LLTFDNGSWRGSPLSVAIQGGVNDAAIRCLIEEGKAKVNGASATKHNIPLHLAAFRNRAEVVSMLLKHGADLEKKNDKGQTPLEIAKIKNHPAVIKVIYAAKVNQYINSLASAVQKATEMNDKFQAQKESGAVPAYRYGGQVFYVTTAIKFGENACDVLRKNSVAEIILDVLDGKKDIGELDSYQDALQIGTHLGDLWQQIKENYLDKLPKKSPAPVV
jgi:ankyrin repeat protein